MSTSRGSQKGRGKAAGHPRSPKKPPHRPLRHTASDRERQAQQDLITRQHEELVQAHRELSAIVNSMREGLTIADIKGQVLRMNPRGAFLLGFPSEKEHLPNLHDFMEVLEIFSPEGRLIPFAEWPFSRTLAGEEVRQFIARVVRRDTKVERMLSYNGTLVRDEAGRPVWAVITYRDVTEQIAAQIAVRESEERFRTMADSTPVMIWVTNEQGDIVMVNHAYEEFFGVTEEEVKPPGTWKVLVHPDDQAAYNQAITRAVQAQTNLDAEVRVRHRSGEWRWVHSYATPRFAADGRFLGHVGSSPDITREKLIEEAHRQVEENLHLMVGAAQEPMMIVNADGLIEAVSKMGLAELGYEEGELNGRNVQDLAEPVSSVEKALRMEDLHKHAPRPLVTTERVYTKSGKTEWMWVETSIVLPGRQPEKFLVKFHRMEITVPPLRKFSPSL